MYVVTDDARGIYDINMHFEYISYWENIDKKHNEEIQRHNPIAVTSQAEELKKIHLIVMNIGTFMAKVKQTKNPEMDNAICSVLEIVRAKASSIPETRAVLATDEIKDKTKIEGIDIPGEKLSSHDDITLRFAKQSGYVFGGGRRRPVSSFADRAIVMREDIAGKTIHATIGMFLDERRSFAVTLYDFDLFEMETVQKLIAGDILIVGGMRDTITEISVSSDGDIVATMENERNICFFQENGGYMTAYNTDNCRQYMHVIGEFYLPVANDIIYEDYSDPDREDPIISKSLEEILKIKAEKEKTSIGFDYYATTITINEELEISVISQGYDVAQ